MRGDKKPFHDRDDLTGEHIIGDAGQIILAVIFIGVWITDTFFLKFSTMFSQYIPDYVKIPVAVILFAIAGYLAIKGMGIVFGKVRETPVVIRDGVFSVVRHPIYLSEILVYLGFLIMGLSLACVFIWIIIIAFFQYISRHEEKLLLARFGDDYRQYMKDVPMWIPQPWRKKKGT
jgi:protein-S-isoprenylcysteine O-methyltransferase Ste14